MLGHIGYALQSYSHYGSSSGKDAFAPELCNSNESSASESKICSVR